MRDLFKAELQRFRGWAIAYAVAHVLVLAFLTRVVDMAQQPVLVYRVFGAVYGLTGVLLGLYQMGKYRRPDMWLNLLHRPLPHWQVAAALVGAGTVLLTIAIAFPILAIAGWQEIMTARVVDLRHWLMPLATCLILVCSYLAGAFAMLGGRRYAAAGLVFLVLLAVGHATATGALALQGLILLWLAAMVASAFKPDLSAPPQSVAAVVATALPVQMGVYLLILMLGFGVEMLWIMQGTHPNNMSAPPHGGHNEIERMSGQQRMLAGLSVSDAADAPLWREQIALSDVYGIRAQIASVPERNELTNVAPMEFDDSKRRVRWVFSHDGMRFEGYSLADGHNVGKLGVGTDNTPFPAPALPAGDLPVLIEGDSVLVAGGSLYHYDSEDGIALHRIRLPDGEVLLGAGAVGESLWALGNRAVYFFDGLDLIRDNGLLMPRHRVAIPGQFGDLRDIDLIERVDGYLMSFSFTEHADDLSGTPPYQTVLRVDDDGSVETVARRAINYDYPALYRYAAWWLSPVMHELRRAAVSLFTNPDPLQATAAPAAPRSIQAFAGALMLLSLLGAVWLIRKQGLSLTARAAWIVACGAIGLPALASLWLLYPQSKRLQLQVHPRPVTA